MSNYIQNCVNGVSRVDEIHDYIEQWHESDSNLTLFEYLGMTESEYIDFIADESNLIEIIKSKIISNELKSINKNLELELI